MYSRQHLSLNILLLAVPSRNSNILIEQFEFCLEGSIAHAKGARKAIGGLFDVSLFTSNIEVGVCFGDGVLIGSLTKAAKNAFQTIMLLIYEIVSTFKFARTHISFTSYLLATLCLCHYVTYKLKLYQVIFSGKWLQFKSEE
jgi:hypothetical protein